MSEALSYAEYGAAVRKFVSLKKECDELSSKLAGLVKQRDEAERAVKDTQNKLYRILSGEG